MSRDTDLLSRIKKTKILIVDDMPQNLQVLGNTLREQGFQIGFATNGKQALSIASVKIPNLILMDMTMPDMDGLTVCKKLREQSITKRIPIIFLTARTGTENIKKALSLGAIDYVVKPFNANDLVKRIIAHLKLDKPPEEAQSEERTALLLKEAYDLLLTDFTTRWNEVRQSLFIDDVVSFSQKLRALGEANNVRFIKEYGDELFGASNGLKIDKMVDILEQFPSIIKKLKDKTEML